MTTKKVTATARVRIELFIDLTDTWGEECTVGQVHQQAMNAAHNAARKLAGTIRGAKVEMVQVQKIYLSPKGGTGE